MGADWGSGLSGAAGGAATGSMFGPIGTAAGGVIGGLVGLFGGKKKKKKPKQLSTLDPQQQALYKDHMAGLNGQGQFADLYKYDAEGANSNFDQNVSRPAYRNFQENIIPGITGQFRSQNLMNSSYTGEALGRAGRNVQENLDAQRSNMIFNGQQQANQNKINGITSALDRQTMAYSKPGPQNPSTLDQILGSLGESSGQYLADYFSKGSGGGTSSPTSSFASLPMGQSNWAGNTAGMAANQFRR
jgi:hypothetical protein